MNALKYAAVLLLILTWGCKNDDANAKDDAAFFPVASFLKGQVSHIDTSVYTIIQITKTERGYDTAYIKREDFKNVAKDFLAIPDIAAKKLKKKYSETKQYDETLGKVVITYTPKDQDLEILREDVIILPNSETGDAVETIYLESMQGNDDSTVQKKMTWEVDKGFQILSIIQKNGAPEKVQNLQVKWANQPSAE